MDDFYNDDEVRPFFGETADTELQRERISRGHHQRRGTIDQLWETRIAAGECPRGYCSGKLDEGCCTLCGWTLADHRARNRVVEKPADWLTRLPGALNLLEEYAPAAVDEDAA